MEPIIALNELTLKFGKSLALDQVSLDLPDDAGLVGLFGVCLLYTSLPSALTASISPMNFDWLPGYEVLQSYPVEIDFDPVDLRPYETAALPEVPMICLLYTSRCV